MLKRENVGFLRPVMKFIADHSCAGDLRYSSRRVWKYSFFSCRYMLLDVFLSKRCCRMAGIVLSM